MPRRPVRPVEAPIGRREVRRRQLRLRGSLGSQLAELREEFGLSQSALAAGAGIDRGHVSRIERGMAVASLDSIVALAASLGADVSVRLYPTSAPRLRDHIQAPMVDCLIRSLHPRWTAHPELPVPAARGFIDLALRLRAGGLSLACEAHSELRSIERIERRLFEKTEALAVLDGSPASSILLVRSTERTRVIARQFDASLRAAFPGSHAAAIAALAGTTPWPGPTLLWARVENGAASLMPEPPRGITVGRGRRAVSGVSGER